MPSVTDAGAPVSPIQVSSGTSGNFTSFSPNSGSTYVVTISANTDNVGTAATLTVAWGSGGSGTWTQAMFVQTNGFSPAKAVWYCTTSSAPGASVIAVTSNAHIAGFVGAVRELTGCATNPVGATATDATTSHTAISLTPVYTGSIAVAALADRSETFTITANGTTTLTGQLTTGGVTFFTSISNATLTGGTAVSLGSSTGAPTAASQIAVEFYAAGALATSTIVHLTTTAADAAVTVGSGTLRLANWLPGSTSTLQNINPTISPPLQLTDGTTAGTNGTAESWYTKPLSAVTIAGQITAALWGRESSTSSNAAPAIKVERCSGDGTVQSTIAAVSPSQGALEFATTAGGATKTCTVSAANVTDTALSDGDRLRITLWIDSAANQGGSGSMAATGNCQLYVNGPVGVAGQAQFTFTETLVENSGSTNATATPSVVAGVTTIPTPTINIPATISASKVAGTATIPTPLAITPAGPVKVTGVASIPTPTINLPITITASKVAATTTIPTPTVPSLAAPAKVAGTATIPTPTVATGETVAAAVVAGTATIPTLTGTATSFPNLPVVVSIPTPTIGSLGPAPVVVAAVTTIPTPVFSSAATITAAVVAVVTTIPTPTVPALVAPAKVAGTATVPTPTINLPATITAAVVAGTATVPTPTINLPATVAAAVVAAVTTIPTPTVTAGNASVNAAKVAAVTTIPTPTISSTATTSAAVVAAVTTIPTPAVTIPGTVSAAKVAGVTTIPTPAISSNTSITASVVACTVDVLAMTGTTSSTATPTVVAGVTTIPTPAVGGSALINAAKVTGVTTIPTPTLATGETATPAVVAATTSIPVPGVGASETATAAVVAAETTIPIPGISAGGSISVGATVVAATTTIPGPGVAQNVNIAAIKITATASIPAPTVSLPATVSATVVTATVTIPGAVIHVGSAASPAVIAVPVTIPTPKRTQPPLHLTGTTAATRSGPGSVTASVGGPSGNQVEGL